MNKHKRAGLKRRTALTPRNILEDISTACAKRVNQNRDMRSKSLKTDANLLGRVIAVNPVREAEDVG